MKRVRSLLRLSSKKQVDFQGDDKDIPAQREIIARFLESQPDWALEGEYVEKAVSAYKKTRYERDKLKDALRDAENGLYDVLIVWKGDRLSRRGRDFPSIVGELTEDFGVEVWSVVDAPGGKQWTARNATETFMLAVEGFKNEAESESTSIRGKETKRQMWAAGEWNGAPTPYGYMLTPLMHNGEIVMKGGRLRRKVVPNPETAHIVREMFRRYNGGEGTVAVTKWLNASGIKAKGGGVWYRMTVRQILENRFYAGYLSSRIRGCEQRGRHEALIDDETWLMAQTVMEARADIPRRQQNADYSLTGFLFCGVCGRRMGGQQSSTRRGEKVYHRLTYRCRSRQYGTKCSLPCRTASSVEIAFLEAIQASRKPSQLKKFFASLADGGRRLADYHALVRVTRERLAKVDDTLSNLTREYLEHQTYTREEYVQLKAQYTAEKSSLEERLKEPAPKVQVVDVSAYIDAAENFEPTWRGATAEERKQLVMSFCHMFGVRLYLHKDSTIELRHVEG